MLVEYSVYLENMTCCLARLLERGVTAKSVETIKLNKQKLVLGLVFPIQFLSVVLSHAMFSSFTAEL